MFDAIVTVLTFAFVFLLDFLCTAFGVWLVTLLLPLLGIDLLFSWGMAFGVWALIKVIRFFFFPARKK